MSTFTYNLIFIPKLLMNTKRCVQFTASSCFLQDPVWKKAVEIGKASKGLYLLNQGTPGFSSTSSTTRHQVCNTLASSSYNKTLELWHVRMGHVPSAVLKLLPFNCDFQKLQDCDICHLSKQSRIAFDSSNSASSTLFDLVHIDLWGPYRCSTHGNCR